jgi:L-ascorbate metabolism protein UlaG (beta-lactamase superfamily)
MVGAGTQPEAAGPEAEQSVPAKGATTVSRSVTLTLILTLALAGCAPAGPPAAGDTPSPPGPQVQSDVDAEVWYLGANGWAVQIGQKMLIFDYQEATDPSPPASGEARNLDRGYVNAEELRDLDLYVFVTHSHADHYDRGIYRWQQQVENITYLFGWAAGNDPEHHYFVEQRAHKDVDGMEVYTIYSHHAGVPEVAFLVSVDGYSIYHNGDYKAQYVEDYAYLHTVAEHIDIAFVIGHAVEDHAYFLQAKLLDELFQPSYIFPMNREGEAYRCHDFAELLAAHGAQANIVVAETRGDHFVCSKNPAE